jgi:hypothetical protein
MGFMGKEFTAIGILILVVLLIGMAVYFVS